MRVYFLANRIFVATFERVLNFRKIRRNVWQLFMQSYWNSCLINFFTIYIRLDFIHFLYSLLEHDKSNFTCKIYRGEERK